MAAACGQSGKHSPHMYQNGTWPNGNPKMVACGGFEPPKPAEPRKPAEQPKPKG